MTDDQKARQAGSFGASAKEYERARPGYPADAVDWLLPAGRPRVLDLGAGTGKLTRALAERGLAVTAVEPLGEMRAALVAALPGVRALDGTAEHLPVDSGSVDVVLAAQAWHWVDPELATPEVARVLAPAGRLGLVWNVRDEGVDHVARLGAIMQQGVEERTHVALTHVEIGAPFGPTETFETGWTDTLTHEGVLDLVRSRSYWITATPDLQERVLDEVRELLATHPDLAGRDTVEVPYRTLCFRADLPA